ncbi:SPOR domain-containing protein [Paenibacillus sedimenti]|uniref:SPOR domain-containing protein n=1 Tax=Paenibacillus sedimenti TaxID=2770274 RepID=A0A926KQM4_9BACL|nr:SPOR domain-containing protein [Paenibacillus sedimenti]MBD0381682.1 SPOR domain-containing protein [Paenibacillus sedimenti]
MNNKARITYRFDQKEQQNQSRKGSSPQVNEDKVIPLYQEEFEVIETSTGDNGSDTVTSMERAERQQAESLFEPHALNTFTTDFGNWNSQIETEGERVERIIRESQSAVENPIDKEKASNRMNPPHADEYRDDWTTWTNNKRPWVEPGTGARYAKSSGAPWIRIATSVAGAVITGIAFGFFVLSMFSTEHEPGETAGKTTVSVPSPNVQSSAPDKSVPANAGAVIQDPSKAADPASAIPSSAAGVTQIQIPAKTYAFLQNGVFSSLQSAQAAQDSLKKKGLASALDGSEKPTVFVGFASTRDDALALSQQLQVQDKALEVYVKNVDIPAAANIRWNGTKPEAVGSFVVEGDKLVKTISGLTVVHLAETKPIALADSSLQAIRTSHQSLTTLSASVNEGIGEDVKPLVQKMTTALNSAVQSMEEYKKSPSTAMLWQAQTSMMQYIIAQKELLKKISVS